MLIDELPVGFSLIGRPFEEETLASIAAKFEETRGALPGPRFIPSLETD